MSYYLILDQYKSPKDINLDYLPKSGWKIARSLEEFKATISEFGIPEFVFLSHDLHKEHSNFSDYKINLSRGWIDYSKYKYPTGIDCVKYLIEVCKNEKKGFPKYEICEENLVGHDNIWREICNFNAQI